MIRSLDGRGKLNSSAASADVSRRDILALAALGLAAGVPGVAAAAGSPGQLIWGVHVSLAPIWFDPAEISGIITPFMVLYALHDAMVKPMPGQSPAPSLAESWSARRTASATSSPCARARCSTMASR
jgi:ABC-type transport system substrate-binding protein